MILLVTLFLPTLQAHQRPTYHYNYTNHQMQTNRYNYSNHQMLTHYYNYTNHQMLTHHYNNQSPTPPTYHHTYTNGSYVLASSSSMEQTSQGKLETHQPHLR